MCVAVRERRSYAQACWIERLNAQERWCNSRSAAVQGWVVLERCLGASDAGGGGYGLGVGERTAIVDRKKARLVRDEGDNGQNSDRRVSRACRRGLGLTWTGRLKGSMRSCDLTSFGRKSASIDSLMQPCGLLVCAPCRACAGNCSMNTPTRISVPANISHTRAHGSSCIYVEA